jgi:metallophosphoesterase superfamily enzyme
MPTLVVISDLHMGSGSIDDFEPEIEKHFIAFLEDWRANNDGTELVINGDLLDFVQAQPYRGRELRAESKDEIPLCFTEDQSLQKLDAIYNEHKDSFQAIGSFLAHRTENRLVLLPGNHDADFYWPAVQQQFKKLVCGDDESVSQRLIYWLDSVYQPSTFPGVWIEHGHQHDPVSSFFMDDEPCWSADNNPIRLDRTGTKRYMSASELGS